jgi:hypothetical protein
LSPTLNCSCHPLAGASIGSITQALRVLSARLSRVGICRQLRQVPMRACASDVRGGGQPSAPAAYCYGRRRLGRRSRTSRILPPPSKYLWLSLAPVDLLGRPRRARRRVIDSSDPELLAEQAINDASNDDETEDDEIRSQTWPGFDHWASPLLTRSGRTGSFLSIESESTDAVCATARPVDYETSRRQRSASCGRSSISP